MYLTGSWGYGTACHADSLNHKDRSRCNPRIRCTGFKAIFSSLNQLCPMLRCVKSVMLCHLCILLEAILDGLLLVGRQEVCLGIVDKCSPDPYSAHQLASVQPFVFCCVPSAQPLHFPEFLYIQSTFLHFGHHFLIKVSARERKADIFEC